METYFASAERADQATLRQTIEFAARNPIIDTVLKTVSGMILVLNEQRQVVALNNTFLEMLNIENPEDLFGKRPGECVNCIHANDMPGGCGTSEYCASCGAVLAVIASMKTEMPVEKNCAIEARRDGEIVNLYLKIRSNPMTFDGERLILVLIQDISLQQEWAVLENLFYHDINNIACAIAGNSELIQIEDNKQPIAEHLLDLSMRLSKEIEIQKCLFKSGISSYQPIFNDIPVGRLLFNIKQLFLNHPAIEGKTLDYPDEIPDISLNTDETLATRVLGNMILNALEASEKDDIVRFMIEEQDGDICFLVWNRQEIPERIKKRVFQRNFSTKKGDSRGLGTFSMKLFGEGILGGRVYFSSTENLGTTFCFRLKI